MWRGPLGPSCLWPSVGPALADPRVRPLRPYLERLQGPGQRGGLVAPQGEEQAQHGLAVPVHARPGRQGLPGLRRRRLGLRLLALLAGVLDEALPPADEARGLRGRGQLTPALGPGPACVMGTRCALRGDVLARTSAQGSWRRGGWGCVRGTEMPSPVTRPGPDCIR